MSTGSRPDVFLSYSREDQATAKRYAEALKREGFNVWWDQTLHTGENYDRVTETALREARAVVVLWSRASADSQWVRAEATTADRRGTLMPAMIEPCERPIMFELKHTAELSHWNGEKKDPAWQTFLADLRRLVNREESTATSAPPASVVLPAASPAPRRGPYGRKLAIAAAAAVLVAATAVGVLSWQRAAKVKQAREALPVIAALVDTGDFPGAFARAQEVRRIIPDDSLLKSLTPLFTTAYTVTSTPSDAEVFVRSYDAVNDQWQSVGRTPLARVDLPRRAMRWRFEKEGFQTLERANSALGYRSGIASYYGPLEAGKLDVTLQPVSKELSGMVYVRGGMSSANVLNRLPPVEVPPFFIDRHEVTNAAFKEFVDAGGYERRSWWEGFDIRQDGRSLKFEEAMRQFVDATGRPGPAAWELGSYAEGKGDHPVAGISWYEAAAYARFRGKTLPTPYHWDRAAFLNDEAASSLAASTAPLSNFGTAGPAPVGQYQGIGPFGTYDLFGNVREWVLNPGVSGGWVVGGSWEDPYYSYSTVAPVALLERSPLNGFRLVRDISEPVDAAGLRGALDLTARGRLDLASLKPVSDEVFETLRRQLPYSTGPLDATEPVTMSATEDWIKQRVSINTGYNNERMDVVLFVPRRARPPFQPVILFSGRQIFTFPGTVDNIEPGFGAIPLDYIVKSGRLLVQPIFQGSFERFKTAFDLRDQVRMSRDMTEWRFDLGRAIDYLATRPDVDVRVMGFVGVSFGGSVAVPLLAVEPRIKAAVLLSGGLERTARTPLIDVVNYAPRIRIPVLMVNGRFDEIFPVETSQLPLFRLLGSPPADKRHVILESGHGSPPRGEVLRETLGWYDKYLGEVRQ